MIIRVYLTYIVLYAYNNIFFNFTVCRTVLYLQHTEYYNVSLFAGQFVWKSEELSLQFPRASERPGHPEMELRPVWWSHRLPVLTPAVYSVACDRGGIGRVRSQTSSPTHHGMYWFRTL